MNPHRRSRRCVLDPHLLRAFGERGSVVTVSAAPLSTNGWRKSKYATKPVVSVEINPTMTALERGASLPFLRVAMSPTTTPTAAERPTLRPTQNPTTAATGNNTNDRPEGSPIWSIANPVTAKSAPTAPPAPTTALAKVNTRLVGHIVRAVTSSHPTPRQQTRSRRELGRSRRCGTWSFRSPAAHTVFTRRHRQGRA